MGVNKVIFLALPLGKLHHAARESGQLGRQILFIQTLVRPGDDINDAQMGFNLNDFTLARPGGARIDVYLDSPAGQLAGDIEDVDVHSARIPEPGCSIGEVCIEIMAMRMALNSTGAILAPARNLRHRKV